MSADDITIKVGKCIAIVIHFFSLSSHKLLQNIAPKIIDAKMRSICAFE
jgi:hypothetical protein